LYAGLDEADCRFAVATMGIKVYRRSYRSPPEARVPSFFRGHGEKDVSDEFLLGRVGKHAAAQDELRPGSAIGPYNLYWCALENKDWKGAHGHIKEAVRRLEGMDPADDVLNATARIEMAGSLVWGSGVGEKTVNFFDVETLYMEFNEQCKGLKKWRMDEFAHGENSQEDIVKEFVRVHSFTAAKLRKEVKAQSDKAAAEGSKVISVMSVAAWKRSDYGMEEHRDTGDAKFRCDGCQKQVEGVKGKLKKCGGCEVRDGASHGRKGRGGGGGRRERGGNR